MKAFFEQQAKRLTMYQLLPYSLQFNFIEYLWRNIKKQATHLRYFPSFDDLKEKVEHKLAYFADTPQDIQNILNLMGRYCRSLGSDDPASSPA